MGKIDFSAPSGFPFPFRRESSEASRGGTRRNSRQSAVFGKAGNGTVVGISELVETTGLELPVLCLPCVKYCDLQINTEKSETFYIISYPISIRAISRQRETEGEKISQTGRNQGPSHAEQLGLLSCFLRCICGSRL